MAQVTKETMAFIKALSAYDNFQAIGRELAVSLDATQEANFTELVIGYKTVKVMLHE
jgi:hypothetical protein